MWYDPKEQSRLLKIFEELEQEEEFQQQEEKLEDDESDVDSIENELDHDTDSELSADEANNTENFSVWSQEGPNYIGKDGKMIWKVHNMRKSSRTRKHNIVTKLPGPKAVARNAKTPLESWNLFITDEIIEEIVKCTNIYLQSIRSNYSRVRDVVETNTEEIKAVFGLLYMAGALKARHTNLSDLWNTDGTAPEFFRMVMSKNRFYLLLRALRFDDITTREERKKLDKLAPIRDIFDKFVDRCQACYSPGDNCTVDEMLEGFRGRCSFKQYIPSKPAKYGIKIFSLADSRVYYTLNMEIYAGRQPLESPFCVDNSPANVVKRLCALIANSGRNITCDNWFTSVSLAEDLKKQRLTIVGTIRKNKREIPEIFVSTKGRPLYSSVFGFGKDCLLLSYVPKANKNVLLLSTLHEDDDIDRETGEAYKPEAITYYNSTKSGVDTVDQKKSLYSVSRISCRWPLRIFFTMLDIAGINGHVIFQFNNLDSTEPRRSYLKKLARELVEPHMLKRVTTQNLPFLLNMQIKKYLRLPTTLDEENVEHIDSTARPKCSYCPKKKNRKTVSKCMKCSKPICKEHTTTYCNQCIHSNPESE